jgi:hypothetical protein
MDDIGGSPRIQEGIVVSIAVVMQQSLDGPLY